MPLNVWVLKAENAEINNFRILIAFTLLPPPGEIIFSLFQRATSIVPMSRASLRYCGRVRTARPRL